MKFMLIVIGQNALRLTLGAGGMFISREALLYCVSSNSALSRVYIMWYSERERRILNVNNPYIHTHTSEHPACTRLSFDKAGCGVYQCVLL